MIKTAVLTVSDSCSQGQRDDLSGQTIVEMLDESIFEVCEKKVVADDHDAIAAALKSFCDQAAVDVIITTGGTGLGPRDVTPEATISVSERMVPGLAELIRAEGFKKTPNAMLSRGVCSMRGSTLIINLPGSPKAVTESLEVVLPLLPHAVKMAAGGGH